MWPKPSRRHWAFYIDGPRLVDIRVVNDRILDTWAHTSQADFRAAIVERDGTCVVTDESAEDCDASHCLPHAKGDEVPSSLDHLTNLLLKYLSSILRRLQHSEIIGTLISCMRNRLPLLHAVHRYVGKGNSAFIMVRDFTYSHFILSS